MTNDERQTAEALTRSLMEVGTAWARYGLNLGRVALETHAQTMTATAGALGALAKALQDKADARAAEPTVVEAD